MICIQLKCVTTGDNAFLRVIVRSYKPSVMCISNPPFSDMGSCHSLVSSARVDYKPFKFVRHKGPGFVPPSGIALVPPDGIKLFDGTSSTSLAGLGWARGEKLKVLVPSYWKMRSDRESHRR